MKFDDISAKIVGLNGWRRRWTEKKQFIIPYMYNLQKMSWFDLLC